MIEGAAMNSHHDAYGNHSPEKGQLWAQGEGEVMLRVLEFAGLPVPEGGLAISPPTGGVLTVWPDGRYEFAPLAHEDSAETTEPISIFYGYVGEDLYGETVAGSFVLARGEDSPNLMQDFQAWSLPELLDKAAEALLAAEASDEAEFFGHGDPDFASHADAAIHASIDLSLDDLSRLILDSQQS
jgi:hypothetical protein